MKNADHGFRQGWTQGILVFGESRIVVQKQQSLLAATHFCSAYRRDNTTLLNDESDIFPP
jgi:Leu/Phe-tRNA-protein transferase